MAMSREEFLRQMGLSKDDVADPEIVVANKREQKVTAQSAFFSKPRDKPYPGYASATPAPPLMSDAGQQKYDSYVNTRVDNVVNDRTDSADEPYMNTAHRKSSNAGGGGDYASRSDWISKGARGDDDDDTSNGRYGGSGGYGGPSSSASAYETPMKDTRAKAPIAPTASSSSAAYVDDSEALVPKKRAGADNISVAQRIAQSSLMFYGAGEDDDDDRRAPPPTKGSLPQDSKARAEFLKSLGIDNAGEGKGATPEVNRAIAASISASTALTGASRTEALSNAVAARRAQRKAALAAGKANGGGLDEDGTSYQPPRSAPSAVDVEPPKMPSRTASRNEYHYGGGSTPPTAETSYGAMARATSEPSGDQMRGCGGGRAPPPRVTIATELRTPTMQSAYEYDAVPTSSINRYSYTPTSVPTPTNSSGKYGRATPTKERESPTKIVNEILYGGPSSSAAPRPAVPPQMPRSTPTYTASRGYDDGGGSSASSLNNTLNSTYKSSTSNAAEYDPETANLTAEELKTLGNKSFEDGDFRKAVRFYSKAITKDSSNAALYSNRSAAYLQASKQMGMDTRSMALRDAEKTIELKPTWFKGYSRKGDVLFKMERYDDAIDAYEMGLQYDEGNPSLMHSIGEARNANGGIARRDKKDTPWAIEQKTNVDVKKAFGGNMSAHELADLNRGTLNDALGTLVMGDDYRRQQLERFKSQREVRSSSGMGMSSGKGGGAAAANAGGTATTHNSTTSSYAANNTGDDGGNTSSNTNGGGGKSLLDMIRSNSPTHVSIPVGVSASSASPGYGRRAGKEPLPESLTTDAATAYQNSLMERYLARKAAAGK